MDNEHLLGAIKKHGAALQAKAEWIHKIVDRQLLSIEKMTDNIERAQNLVELFRDDLIAIEIALNALRVEYREMIQVEGDSSAESGQCPIES